MAPLQIGSCPSLLLGRQRLDLDKDKIIAKIEGVVLMREEGLVYDAQMGGFLHIYRDNGDIIIDKQPCEHEHSVMVVGAD